MKERVNSTGAGLEFLAASPLPLLAMDQGWKVVRVSRGFSRYYDEASLTQPPSALPTNDHEIQATLRVKDTSGVLQTLAARVWNWHDVTVVALAGPHDASQTALVGQLQQRLTELESQALTDALTGLWNRRYFDAVVGAEIARAARYKHPLSLLVLDVDHFKRVNDVYGHAVGDDVLCAVAGLLRKRCRNGDILMRWGGDEFAVLAPLTSHDGALALAEGLRRAAANMAIGAGIAVTLSIGVAELKAEESAAAWFQRVDSQLYGAKAKGRNQVVAGTEVQRGRRDSALQFAWRPEYACGQATLDDQHRILFQLTNRVLADAGLSGEAGRPHLLEDLDQLLDHVAMHFADEIDILTAAQYPAVQAHAQLHAALLAQARQLRAELVDPKTELTALLDFLVHDMVHGHVMEEDRMFFAHVAELS